MTDLAVPESEDLVLPHSGEVISLQDAGAVANALADIGRIRALMRDTESILKSALVEESMKQGTKTLHLPGVTVEIRKQDGLEWDIDALESGLRAAGIPEERLREVVKEEVSYRVSVREANRVSKANPAYAAVVDAAKTVMEKPPSVVLRKGSA